MTERRRWWRDVLSGAATLLDIGGTGTAPRGWRLFTPMTRVTWAVTDEDLGPGWVTQDLAQVEPVPASVTWVHAHWKAHQEVAAEWAVPGVLEVTQPARVWVTAREVRHVSGNVLLVPGKVHPAWAEWIESLANAS